MSPRLYKGYTIIPRTFQVRGSDRWTVDILIGRRGALRAFSRTDTCDSEPAANAAGWSLGCSIIDQSSLDCPVRELSESASFRRPV
jgi:hypothetical protein